MAKWYILGYFVIGLIVDIADRISDDLLFDEPYYEAEDSGTQFMFHVLLVLLWPAALAVVSGIAINASLSALSKWITKQIKERSKHEQTESKDRHRG